eukprot:CAMPEP_0114988284 /NCGR_PEP_ID=MMETSP0216-20121206/9511_1 /TAXON_ID=223996 /ORGANISM="Protocruzia adherens, Strain Boccale" /LENGTH=289 /DNA_ID=CAMNT_0002351043 /DNA_START=52 /DNA_END=921 /DNA_ORIENTATION=-
MASRFHCKECKEDINIITNYTEGNIVCTNCGLVLDEKLIDEASEWRNFGNDNGNRGSDPTRTSGPINILFEGDENTNSGEQKMIGKGRGLIRTIGSVSNIPNNVREKCEETLVKVIRNKSLRGRPLEAVVAAIIFHSCRAYNTPRPMKEVLRITGTKQKDVAKCLKAVKKMDPDKDSSTPVNLRDHAIRFSAQLTVKAELERIAVQIADKLTNDGNMAGKNPTSVASALIFLVTHLYPDNQLSFSDISKVTKVSDVTIKNTYKSLYEMRFDLLTDKIVPKQYLSNLPKY